MSKPGTLKNKLQSILQKAGITINGPNAWDPQVHDDRFYAQVIARGSVGLGEAYMDALIDIKQPEEFFSRILRSRLDETVKSTDSLLTFIHSVIVNEQNKKRSLQPAIKHYNLSPELYISFLDKYNQYSCCYFPLGTETLEEAAVKKLHLICKKLQLSSKDRLLDIGCGWGGLAKFAAENYGCHVTGISISEEQVKYARSNTTGLPVEFIVTDYRDFSGTFDKIVSVGMFEHVGYKNYAGYMKLVNNFLADDGIFLLHTIGRNESLTHGDPWLHKYIFPNHMLPSIKQVGAATEGLFVMEDWHNFSAHYYHTLMGWYNNFVANWGTLKKDKPEYDERFYRMWTYYLLCCAGAFSSRRHQLWQIVFTKRGMMGGYQSVR